MIPRGEVGLIFAGVGACLTLNGTPVIGSATFAVIVTMVVITTVITPPVLKWSFARGRVSRLPKNPAT
jgi:Kef-type K+ transport system membrane component KefB